MTKGRVGASVRVQRWLKDQPLQDEAGAAETGGSVILRHGSTKESFYNET
jgi:hypothetical protein